MTDPKFTLERFRRSGKSHIECAQHVLKQAREVRSTQSHIGPGSAAYLAHVALECVLKARLLSRNACACAEDLEEKHPKVYEALFRGRNGHNLRFLADKLELPALVRNEGRPWVEDACWKRIASVARPYSLRYGAEDLDDVAVERELQRASSIIDAVLAGTRKVPLDKQRRGSRRPQS